MKERFHIFQFATSPVCAPCRLWAPGKHLARSQNLKVTAFEQMDGQILRSLLENGDMLIVQRVTMSRKFFKLLTAVNQVGILLIYEIDDDLLNLDPDSSFARMVPGDFSDRIKQAISSSHAVQCSTHHLARVISEFHPEVTVLENQLEHLPLLVDRKMKGRPLIIGYAAGEHHWLDWQTVRDAYNRVIAELENSGHKIETWIMGDKAIYESLDTQNKKYFPLASHEQYLEILSCFDISLIPLSDSTFNRSKSDVKFLESASRGCAVIASTTVYSDSIRHEQTGLLFSDQPEFQACLKSLICNPGRIPQLGKNAYYYVKKNRLLSRHINKWEATYHRWFKNKNALLANVPAKQSFIVS